MVAGSTKKIILLGSTGFVGKAILNKIASHEERFEVTSLLRKAKDKSAMNREGHVSVIGDMTDLPNGLLPDSPHVLIHFATKNIDHDGTGFDSVNVKGTRDLLHQVNKYTKGIIYGSSMSVYGAGEQVKVREDSPLRPATALARTRAEAEKQVLDTAGKWGIWGIVLRPRFILGTGDRFIIPGLLKMGHQKVNLIKGNPKYAIIDVEDYAESILKLVQLIFSETKMPLQKALNIGYEEPMALQDILKEFGIEQKRFTLPLNGTVLKIISLLNFSQVRKFREKIALIGLSHYGDVSEAMALIGRHPLSKKPAQVVKVIRENHEKNRKS